MSNVSITSSIAGSVSEFLKNLPQIISHVVGRTITIIGNHPARMQASPLAAGLTFAAANGAALVASHKIANYVEDTIHEWNFGTFATIKSGVTFISVAAIVGGISAGASTLVSLATAYPLTPAALVAISVAAVVVRYVFKDYKAKADARAQVEEVQRQEDERAQQQREAQAERERQQQLEAAERDRLAAEQAPQKRLEDQAAYETIEQQYNAKIAPSEDLTPQERGKLRNLDLDNILDILSAKKPGEEDKSLTKTGKSPHKDRKALKREELAKTIAEANQLKDQICRAIVDRSPNLNTLKNTLLRDNATKYNAIVREFLAL